MTRHENGALENALFKPKKFENARRFVSWQKTFWKRSDNHVLSRDFPDRVILKHKSTEETGDCCAEPSLKKFFRRSVEGAYKWIRQVDVGYLSHLTK